jgi:hypothetical protein
MSGWSGGSEKNRILTVSPLAACLLESMESDPIDFAENNKIKGTGVDFISALLLPSKQSDSGTFG